ncbi:MAG: F0F1 ATP synthase subunit delta [Candidatus Omnitrophica bacterium]|nr:F0F1 ATP synthase subunit delta [Candidatus Omnitrophota bacterium]
MVFQLVIVQVVTFVAIVFVLRKLLYSESVKEALRLKKLKEETAQKQQELQQKIDAAQDAYKEKMMEAEEVSRAYHLKSKEEAQELKKQILDKANEEAEQIVRSAFNAKEKMREEIAEEMRKRMPMLISRIFKEFLSPAVRDVAHKELVRDVMDKIKKAEKITLKSRVDKGEIVSARPLSDNDKREIEMLIRNNLGYEVSLRGKEDSELVAGVIIKFGTILIDGSLDNRLKQVGKELGL